MPPASKNRHPGRSPRVRPLAAPRTGSAESRPPGYASDGPNSQSPGAESFEIVDSRFRALLSGIFVRNGDARQTSPRFWVKIALQDMILRSAVPHSPSAFHRLLEPLDRRMIARAVATHGGDHGVGNGDNAWTCERHLKSLLFAQWAGLTSLRQIVAGLGAHSQSFYHLNLRAPCRSTLAEVTSNHTGRFCRGS